MFEYGNHAVAITKAFLAHTFHCNLLESSNSKKISKLFGFSSIFRSASTSCTTFDWSICSFVRANSYDDDDDDDDEEENEYDKDDKTGQVAGRQVAPYAASSSHSV